MNGVMTNYEVDMYHVIVQYFDAGKGFKELVPYFAEYEEFDTLTKALEYVWQKTENFTTTYTAAKFIRIRMITPQGDKGDTILRPDESTGGINHKMYVATE